MVVEIKNISIFFRVKTMWLGGKVIKILKFIWNLIWNKERIEMVKNIVTIVAFLVGGYWTYTNFILERRAYPHASIEQKISHIPLSDQINLMRIEIGLTNTGNAILVSRRQLIRIQQILPMVPCKEGEPCATKQVNTALREAERKDDRFIWPLVAERKILVESPREIEPGEKDQIDFEFAVPSDIKVVRVYAYFQNDTKTKLYKDEIGWKTSIYYDFRKKGKGVIR
jgi:hypothetical protein